MSSSLSQYLITDDSVTLTDVVLYLPASTVNR